MTSTLLIEHDNAQSFCWAGKLRLAGHDVMVCPTVLLALM